MHRTLMAAVLMAFFSPNMMFSQYGIATSNYYPLSYQGSTFSGTVADTSEETMTLTFVKGQKSETFTGRLEKPCVIKEGHGMTASDFPKGTELTALFDPITKKVEGKKITGNIIVGVVLRSWRARKIEGDKRIIYWCTDSRQLQFKSFR